MVSLVLPIVLHAMHSRAYPLPSRKGRRGAIISWYHVCPLQLGLLKIYDTCISKTNFFSSMSWQQLKVISFVSRDTTGQKNGMCLGIVVEGADKIVDLNKRQGIVR